MLMSVLVLVLAALSIWIQIMMGRSYHEVSLGRVVTQMTVDERSIVVTALMSLLFGILTTVEVMSRIAFQGSGGLAMWKNIAMFAAMLVVIMSISFFVMRVVYHLTASISYRCLDAGLKRTAPMTKIYKTQGRRVIKRRTKKRAL